MTPAHAAGWQNPRILLTLAVVFLCGVTVGMLVHHLMHGAPPAVDHHLGTRDALFAKLKAELNLTTDQTAQLETVLDDFFTYYYTLQAQLDDVRASGKQRIYRILNDGQKRKFEKIMNESEQEKRLH